MMFRSLKQAESNIGDCDMSTKEKRDNALTVETLITTMNLVDGEELVSKMNIKQSYIIGNQCDRNSVEKINGGLIVSTDMRGVGKNRNSIIERASADICVLADDDMVFCDGYEDIVRNCFERHPEADVIIFNFISESEGRRVAFKDKNIGRFNYMNYGAARIAFRRECLAYHSILFNTMFGGGTPHQCGEDSLFLNACLRNKLKIVVVPDALASLTEDRESTWFKGYTEKYFFDKGVFLAIAHPFLCKLFAALLIFRHGEYCSQSKMSRREVYKAISNGIRYVKKRMVL